MEQDFRLSVMKNAKPDPNGSDPDGSHKSQQQFVSRMIKTVLAEAGAQ